jgi:hypothetical protein
MSISVLPVKLGFDPLNKYLKLCQSHRGYDGVLRRKINTLFNRHLYSHLILIIFPVLGIFGVENQTIYPESVRFGI